MNATPKQQSHYNLSKMGFNNPNITVEIEDHMINWGHCLDLYFSNTQLKEFLEGEYETVEELGTSKGVTYYACRNIPNGPEIISTLINAYQLEYRIWESA